MRLTSLVLLLVATGFLSAADEPARPLTFKTQEIEKGLGVGYAVILADVDGDGHSDIVVVDQQRVVWYQAPDWKRRSIIEGHTAPDNVCIAAHDIDGDGKIDFALGAGWKPFDTKKGGTLQWLSRGKTLDDPWTVHPIAEEPTLHRIRFGIIENKPALFVAPLMGRDSTQAKNFMDGQPVRLLAYRVPADPVRDRWTPEVVDESLHVMHNFFLSLPKSKADTSFVLTASYDGVHRLDRVDGRWQKEKLGSGNQDKPNDRRGASEIKQGRFKDGTPFIATIEPWHGHQVVVYTPDGPDKEWKRRVLDDQLLWGHAVWCADLDGDGDDELIIGVRDNKSVKSGERCGVRIYKSVGGHWEKWDRQLVDEGGVAVEDLTVGDLDGDGKPDIIAVGRATHNARIYWNKGR
jgi:hypothetical protein